MQRPAQQPQKPRVVLPNIGSKSLDKCYRPASVPSTSVLQAVRLAHKVKISPGLRMSPERAAAFPRL